MRHERVTILLALVSETLAMRARALEDGPPPALDHDAFVGNLVDMAVGALSAPGVRRDRMPPYVEGHSLLEGKGVLVTAAAGTGIGFATAKRCRKRARGS